MPSTLFNRTKNYGRVNSLDEKRDNDTICSVPIHMKSEERWICHLIYPSYHGILRKGDQGAYIVLVDNFGELYYWRGGRQYSDILVYPANDKEADNYRREDMNKFIIQPKEDKSFAFTDDFIDILKSSYSPQDTILFEANRSHKPTIGIENYVNTLLEKNKDIVNKIENLLKEHNEYVEEYMDYKPLHASTYTRENILSAAEKRVEQEKMRGFLDIASSKRYHIKINSSIDKSPEEDKLNKIVYSWTHES